MRFESIQKIVGALLVLASLTMLPPALVSWIYDDGSWSAFLQGGSVLILFGALLWWPVRGRRQDLRIRDGFLVVVACWVVLSLCSALPLWLSYYPYLSLTDAVFEATSGLTTTGATVLTGLDQLPKGILFYRQQLQWLGGMGIIVLAVAILPMLRIGGMQLYRAETPGPMKDSKLTPRITETAKALWYLYLGLTVVCGLAYWMAGMSIFDAVSHAFSTVAIGGFSTHDLSIAYFDNPVIETIAIVFMLLSGMNFALHFMAWRRASMSPYLGDPELKAYLTIMGGGAILCVAGLFVAEQFGDFGQAFRHGVFQAVSAGTTTGFTTDGFYQWPGALPLLLLVMSCVGGCAGSTGGGTKVIRVVLMYKQGLREIAQLIHPNAVVPVKLGAKAMSEKVLRSVWGFFAIYAICFGFLSMLLAAMGLDLLTAVSAVLSCMNNLGPALGDAGPHYAELTAPAKWVLSLTMVMGRLELFTLLVLFTPVFWRD